MALLRIIDESDVRSLLDGDTALAITRAALRDHAAGKNRLSTPSAMTLDASDDGGPRFKFKAASLGSLRVSGIRLLCRFDGNTGPSACNYVAIYDHAGRGLVGLVSELWLSRIRTAAFGVAVVEPLVRSGPLSIGLFGTGDIATEIAPLLARAFEIREIRVNSRRAEQARFFAQKFEAALGVRIRSEQDPAAVVRGADLVITLTESREPLVTPGLLAPGAVLCSMGSYNEVDFEVIREIDRIIVDDPDYAMNMGDGAAWIAQGRLTRSEFVSRIDALAAEVTVGLKPGRLTADSRILAIVQGMATGDIAFAAHILQRADAIGVGRSIQLA